ncbi:LuxR C-terminal-related transcriptional regulator [Dactylosporangium sp. NPDC005572]|uniref:LuxR C-terminal-related transcriptional regulator n=1 Tax=Dactylosporangium sp. NPDC005572 TaxID=3156889 RepID=UPI0033B03AC2
MLRDVLRRELDRMEPGLEPILHGRAADWLQQHGMVADAVRHAMAAGDTVCARDLVHRDYFRVANDGQVSTAISWFDTLGAATLQSDARLLVARAMTAVLSGDLEGGLAWLQEAEGRPDLDPATRDDIEAKTALLHQMHSYADGDMARACDWSAVALRRVPRDDVWHGTALAHAAGVDLRRGEDDTALHALRRCLTRADATAHHLLAVRAMGNLQVLYCGRGDRDAVREWVDRAAGDPRWQRLDEHTLTYARHFAEGWLALAEDRPEAAEPCLDRAWELVRRGPYRVEQAEVRATLAIARARLGRTADAAGLRADVKRILAGCPSPGRLVVPAGESAAGPETGAGGRLTEREVAVLAVLAEGLTNAQMARRLHVSERTVAAHLRAIYRKIGVGTRSAATRYALDNNLSH